MRTFPLLVAVTLASLSLAGCVNEEESTADERQRGFSVSIPEEVRRIRVDVSARSNDDVDLRVEVEREDRSNLAEDEIALSRNNASRVLEADVTGLNTTWVLVTANGGDATVRVRVTGIADDGTEIFLREETLQISQAPRPPRVVSPTVATNATTDDNATASTNDTNETAPTNGTNASS